MAKHPLPEGVPEEALREDARVARERGLKFYVVRKARRGKRWEEVADGVEDLVEAVSLAGQIRDAYESGVFVNYEGVGGFIYWTSLHADLLSSSVLLSKFDRTE